MSVNADVSSDRSEPVSPAKLIHARRFAHWFSVLVLMASDTLVFFLTETIFRAGHAVPHILFVPAYPFIQRPIDLFLVLGFVFIVTRYLGGDYRRRRPFWENAKSTTLVLFIVSLPSFLVLLAMPGHYSISAVVESWICVLFAIPLMRQITRLALTRLGIWQRPAALVAKSSRSASVHAALSRSLSLGYDFRWLIIGEPSETPYPESMAHLIQIPLTDAGTVSAALAADGCEEVVVSSDDMQAAEFTNVIQRLLESNIHVAFVPTFRRLPIVGSLPSYFFGRDILLFQVRGNLLQLPQRVIKRAFDIVGAIAALILLMPLFVAVTVLIKVRYPDVPVLFGEHVTGRSGRVFVMWKFSTMVKNAHLLLEEVLKNDEALRKEWEETTKLRDDPRVLKGVGKFLRRTSLNELPQLFNVLIGDMSLVGPRPVNDKDLKQYYGPAAQLYKRVRPGVTGLWQVSGRSDTTYEERINYDEWYVLNWSFWYDIVILLQTVGIVLFGKGAY